MNLILILALIFVHASFGFAEDAPAPDAPAQSQIAAKGQPAPELLGLEKELIQRQSEKEHGTAASEDYKTFLAKFRPRLDAVVIRVPPTPANKSVHARILVRLGDSARALKGLNAALEGDPKNPALITAKGYALYDQKDYAGAAAAANAILHDDPRNLEAQWLKHASEDRNAPKVTLPGSPWAAASDDVPAAGGGARNDDAGKPYTLAIKVRATPAPPEITPASSPAAPPAQSSPLGACPSNRRL